jgi:hypothetical protein
MKWTRSINCNKYIRTNLLEQIKFISAMQLIVKVLAKTLEVSVKVVHQMVACS